MNRELAGMPVSVQDGALAEVARELARQFDAGHVPAASQLTRVLGELRKLVVAAAAGPADQGGAVEEADAVDDLASRRADRLADAAGGERAGVGDERRRGGGRPR